MENNTCTVLEIVLIVLLDNNILTTAFGAIGRTIGTLPANQNASTFIRHDVKHDSYLIRLPTIRDRAEKNPTRSIKQTVLFKTTVDKCTERARRSCFHKDMIH